MMMIKKTVSTFIADIYIAGDLFEIEHSCEEFIKKETDGLCVNVVDCAFVHNDGTDLGAKVTIIAYPRFPKTEDKIEKIAVKLAEYLIVKLEQLSASVVCSPGNTTYIAKPEKEKKKKVKDTYVELSTSKK